MSDHEQRARAYLIALMARHGWPQDVEEVDVRSLAVLIREAVAIERAACAEIGDDFALRCGSWAAQEIAASIRARGVGEKA